MNARFPQKLDRKVKAATNQRLPKKSRHRRPGKLKVSAPVGTETELPPGEPRARTFTVQIISAETIAAGFPFGLRLNVFAADPDSAVDEASEELNRLEVSIRERARAAFVAEASRALTGA